MLWRLTQAHLSPISEPDESYHAFRSGSVIASASSWPSAMLHGTLAAFYNISGIMAFVPASRWFSITVCAWY